MWSTFKPRRSPTTGGAWLYFREAITRLNSAALSILLGAIQDACVGLLLGHVTLR